MSSPGLWANIFGRLAYEFAQWQPMLPTYLHLILSAMFPIFTAAHASLSRPDSAAPPAKSESGLATSGHDAVDDDDEGGEKRTMVEGMSPSDAIVFPLLAGATLTGLYFLIKWLQDPALLNKILGWYFGVMGVFGVYKFAADLLRVGHSFIFPRWYSSRGVLWRADNTNRRFLATSGENTQSKPRSSPLPGLMSVLPLGDTLHGFLWTVRLLPNQRLTVKFHIHRAVTFKTNINIFDIIGALVGLCASLATNFVKSPWWLTNLMGFAFSYSALQLLSPTTFGTANLVLGALFVYDIFMVFYTPMMVTVAKSLDVPIKLVFPRPPAPGEDPSKVAHAMLGLGDVVLPGMVIGLALRFDLFMHYLHLQKHVKSRSGGDTKSMEKVPFVAPSKHWANHFWTSSWRSQMPPTQQLPQTGDFRKTYFKAGLTGYIMGMIATLLGMHYSKHPQPALLYLVPGVLSSLWLTALCRGELSQMWHFTEESAEDEQKIDAEDGLGSTPGSKNPEQQSDSATEQRPANPLRHSDQITDGATKEQPEGDIVDLFHFSISRRHRVARSNATQNTSRAGKDDQDDRSSNLKPDGMPAAKRARKT